LGFEEITGFDKDIEKRLRQAITDHDEKSLMRIMLWKLTEWPKIFQTLAALYSM
jgi:hypothetical protein